MQNPSARIEVLVSWDQVVLLIDKIVINTTAMITKDDFCLNDVNVLRKAANLIEYELKGQYEDFTFDGRADS